MSEEKQCEIKHKFEHPPMRMVNTIPIEPKKYAGRDNRSNEYQSSEKSE